MEKVLTWVAFAAVFTTYITLGRYKLRDARRRVFEEKRDDNKPLVPVDEACAAYCCG